MRVRCVCVCVMLLRPKMNSVTKSRTHQDTERSESLAWEKWKLTWVSLVQLGVSGKSGIHPYRNSEHRNKEQSLMEECKYQALTVDLTLKSSWTWTIFLSVSTVSRSTWTIFNIFKIKKMDNPSPHSILSFKLQVHMSGLDMSSNTPQCQHFQVLNMDDDGMDLKTHLCHQVREMGFDTLYNYQFGMVNSM